LDRRTRRLRSREDWQVLLVEQARSGLSQKAFCELHGVTPSAFYNAKSRLRLDAMVPVETPTFVGVTVEHDGVAKQASAWDVELSLGEGVMLRIRRSVGMR